MVGGTRRPAVTRPVRRCPSGAVPALLPMRCALIACAAVRRNRRAARRHPGKAAPRRQRQADTGVTRPPGASPPRYSSPTRRVPLLASPNRSPTGSLWRSHHRAMVSRTGSTSASQPTMQSSTAPRIGRSAARYYAAGPRRMRHGRQRSHRGDEHLQRSSPFGWRQVLLERDGMQRQHAGSFDRGIAEVVRGLQLRIRPEGRKALLRLEGQQMHFVRSVTRFRAQRPEHLEQPGRRGAP